MFKQKWKRYAFWIMLSELVGLAAGLLTRKAVEIYSTTIAKPPLSPPALVFPIVWTILYALMGISAARISLLLPSRERSGGLRLFLLQLAVNFFWSILFFSLQAFGFAFLWLVLLWVLIVRMLLCFADLDRPAAWLQLPYLVWVFFAGYLNFGVWLLNR